MGSRSFPNLAGRGRSAQRRRSSTATSSTSSRTTTSRRANSGCSTTALRGRSRGMRTGAAASTSVRQSFPLGAKAGASSPWRRSPICSATGPSNRRRLSRLPTLRSSTARTASSGTRTRALRRSSAFLVRSTSQGPTSTATSRGTMTPLRSSTTSGAARRYCSAANTSTMENSSTSRPTTTGGVVTARTTRRSSLRPTAAKEMQTGSSSSARGRAMSF